MGVKETKNRPYWPLFGNSLGWAYLGFGTGWENGDFIRVPIGDNQKTLLDVHLYVPAVCTRLACASRRGYLNGSIPLIDLTDLTFHLADLLSLKELRRQKIT